MGKSDVHRAIQYVIQQRNRSRSDQEIKWSLIESGWTKAAIEQLWRDLPPVGSEQQPPRMRSKLQDHRSDDQDDERRNEAQDEAFDSRGRDAPAGEAPAWYGDGVIPAYGSLCITPEQLVFRFNRGLVRRDDIELRWADITRVRQQHTSTSAKMKVGGLLGGAEQTLYLQDGLGRTHKLLVPEATCAYITSLVKDGATIGAGVNGQKPRDNASRQARMATVCQLGDGTRPSGGTIIAIIVACAIGVVWLIGQDRDNIEEEALASVDTFISNLNSIKGFDAGVRYQPAGVRMCGDRLIMRVQWTSPKPVNRWGETSQSELGRISGGPFYTQGYIYCPWGGDQWSAGITSMFLDANLSWAADWAQGTPIGP